MNLPKPWKANEETTKRATGRDEDEIVVRYALTKDVKAVASNDKDESEAASQIEFTALDLLSFTWQIASGMVRNNTTETESHMFTRQIFLFV